MIRAQLLFARRHVICLLFFWPILTVSAETIRLGVSAPLSGGGAGWGNDVRNVLTFANEKLAAGRYSFVFEDDLCDPKTALTAARKLSDVDKVKAVFIVCGQAALAAAEAYKKKGVTVLATLATPSRISDLGVFRTSLSDALAAEMLAEYISAHHDAVSALSEENDYSVSFMQDFLSSAGKLKLKVKNENYLAAQSDFRPQLLKMKKDNVAALFLNTQTEEALANLLRQLKELSFSPKLYGAYLPGSEHFLQLGGKLAEGLVFVDFPGAEELLTAEGKALYSEYLSRFGPLYGWTFAFPATFEAFRVVHLGLSSGEPLEDYLRKTEFNGLIGKYSFKSNGDINGLHHVLRIITEGKSIPLAASVR